MYRRYTVSVLVCVAGASAVLGGLVWLRGHLGQEQQEQLARPTVERSPAELRAVPVIDPEPSSAAGLIPERIRRLSNAEFNGTVRALLGTELAPGHHFAPDIRQAGFTENEAQQVDAVLGKQLFAAAEKLAAEARGRIAQLAPCATPTDAEACARNFIASFGARAYRRPLEPEEATGLLEVFRAGALDAKYEDGIELVMRAVLQSAGMLYMT
jgi:hypothetical protein